MFRGYILRYLALVADGTPAEQAAQQLPASLRALVVRLARGAVIASGFETEHSDDEAHVHRLAYLRTVGRPAIDPNRIEDVRQRWESSRDRRAEGSAALRLGVSASLVLTGLVAGGGVAYVLTRPPPPRPRTPAAAVAEEAASEVTAEPAHVLTALFEETLPAYVVALDARSAGREPMPPADVAGTRAAVLDAAARLSPALTESLTGLLDASESFSSGGTPFADEAWLERLVLFHDALAANDIPFYVDAQLVSESYPPRRRVLLSTYDVVARRRFSYVEAEQVVEVRTLSLERLDRLSFTQSLLGYTRSEIRHALVLMDRIEGFLVAQLLPSIHSADESVFVRSFTDERDTHWVTDFETWAHEDLAADARDALAERSVPSEQLATLAAAIVARRHAIDSMSYSLRRRGIELLQPMTYAFDPERLSGFRDGANGGDLATVRQAQSVLDGAGAESAYAALLDAFASSVAEHEVQHRIDYEADRLAHVPPALAEYTGETESEDRVNHRAERANAELSAYLSQVARSARHARTSLLHVASFVLDRDSWNLPEAYAALVVFSSLAREAGIEHGDLVVARRIVRAEIAAIYGALRARPDLADLAARAWATLYGSPLVALTRLD